MDQSAITEIKCDTSNRTMFQVKGTDGANHVILPSSWRCSCPNWIYKTWIQSECVTCKHALATKLCQAIMNSSETMECIYLRKQTVTQQNYIQMLANME